MTHHAGDKDNTTSQILDVLLDCPLPKDSRLTIVLGSAAPHLASVQKAAMAMPVQTRVLYDVTDMAALMACADLSIGGGGSTAWERCCLGLPTLMLTIADNQLSIAKALDNAKAAVYVGDVRDDGWKPLLVDKMKLAADENWRKDISATAAAICDGNGAARTADAINKLLAEQALYQASK